MPTARVNGASIHYSETGHGVPLVLLHGYPLDNRVWQYQCRELQNICRVIAPDLPGFGRSTAHGPFTIESLADDVFALLTSIKALPCVLGGLSMGGYVALAYQAKYANTLRGLILADTRAEADTPEGKLGRDKQIDLVQKEGSGAVADVMLPRMLADGNAHVRPEVGKELREIMAHCPPKTIECALAAMRDRPDYRGTLASIVAPTLIIVGQGDLVTPVAEAQAMQTVIRGSHLSIIPGAGHMSPMERPRDVGLAIEHFLKAQNR
jgi:pimeloyl-ACP methyl ester carboxylesterase